jgi:hypothetical protein
MKKIMMIMAGLLLMLTGCRQESDNVMSYAFNDAMAFQKADTSFVGEFEVFWNGMNTNYALWDYELENGLDWDNVYQKYYPKFAELDEKDTVTDEELGNLLNEIVKPLHDGHVVIKLMNHSTGNYVTASPSHLRVGDEREEEYTATKNFLPSLKYYQDKGKILEMRSASTNVIGQLIGIWVAYIKEQITGLKLKTDRTQDEEERLNAFQSAYNDLYQIVKTDNLDAYNPFAIRYEWLHIPYLEPIDLNLYEHPVDITYALLEGNIAYLSFNHFRLSAYLDADICKEFFGQPTGLTKVAVESVQNTWNSWFSAIQELKKAGNLGGVIIDVRSNGGGMLNDYQYVLGALLPSGGHHMADARFKRGLGRFDYSPIMPQTMPTMEAEHETVTEPIVVLCNCNSVSMAEMTSMGAKVLENGTLIGTRTWGGFSALSSNENYSNNYAGYVGIQNVTPVFCYIPQEVTFSILDGKIVEGHGVEPDIEVSMDFDAWNKGNGSDSQLDRALQFIRTGN